ncbi:MAG: hypothetical protein RLZZ01_124 [Actinomycetota bacterium]
MQTSIAGITSRPLEWRGKSESRQGTAGEDQSLEELDDEVPEPELDELVLDEPELVEPSDEPDPLDDEPRLSVL